MANRYTPAPERLMALIEKRPNGCWEFIGCKTRDGYGKFAFKGRTSTAHRSAWILFRGEIPKGLEVDHLCENKACANPDHMQIVPPRVNVLRAPSASGMNARKTHCVRGHEFSAENTLIYYSDKGHPRRQCRTCVNDRQRERYHAK